MTTQYIKLEPKYPLVNKRQSTDIFWTSYKLWFIGSLIFLFAGCTPSSGDLGVWNTFTNFVYTLTKSEYFWYALWIGLLAQTIDGALGMAYGLTSNSFLLSIGATPAAASGAVHVAEIFTTAASGTAHIRFKNVDKPLLIKIVFPGVLGGVLGVLLIHHIWDPKQQRPELWSLFNTRKNLRESMRVFPLSNWTELDIWQYIHHQQIPIVPLYFAKARPVVQRDGMLMMVDDERFRLRAGATIEERVVRFRTLGCYPLTGAVESQATNVSDIILELLSSRESERQGRAIDHDSSASMEKKKQAGYF